MNCKEKNMETNKREINISGVCPICEAVVASDERVEESEILICGDCQSSLVVDSVNADCLILSEAPEIEEDWGE